VITSLYCTLADVKSELNADSTIDDKKVMRGIRQLSRRIDKMFRSNVALFVPNILTRQVMIDGVNVSSWNNTLMIRPTDATYAPLLDPTGVTVNNRALVIGTNVQSYPPLASPITALQLIGDCCVSWYDDCNAMTRGLRFATIAGVWGYNVDYANAWLAVDALDAGIDASVTTLTVDDVDGDNPYGESPRISAGNVIQIDTEWMDVIATDTLTNTVTVIRGVNGSTAAAHSMGAAVSVYLVDENIRRIARQAAFSYARIGAFDTTRITDFSTIQFPSDLLQEIADLLQMFANE
jgi:hypothetical protein